MSSADKPDAAAREGENWKTSYAYTSLLLDVISVYSGVRRDGEKRYLGEPNAIGGN